jgi:sugar phosphate permease
MKKAQLFYGWKIVGATFIFMMMVVGFSLYGLPLFYNWWVRDFGWKRAEIQLGNTLSRIIVGPLFGFIVGWALERIGPRRVMAIGAIFAGAALAGFSVATSLRQLYLFYFFNALGYLCAGPLPSQVLLSKWFKRLRGRVMGIAYVGIGVGGMIVPWLVLWFTRAFGWPWALRLLGIIMAITLLVLAVTVIRRQPSDFGMLPDGDEQKDEAPIASPALSLSQVFRTQAFWLLALGSVMSISAIGGVVQNLALYIADVLPGPQADLAKTQVFSMTLFASIGGRVTMGYLADRIPKKYVMILTYLLVASSIPLLVLARDYPSLLYVFAVTFGFGLGADYMLIPLMAAECFGLAALSRVLGIIITSDSIGEALMPYLVAHSRDTSGSYVGGLFLTTVFAFIGAIAIASIRYRNGVPVSRLAIEMSKSS